MITEVISVNTPGASLNHDNSNIADSKRYLRALFESNEFGVVNNNSNQKVAEATKKKTFEENIKLESRKTDYKALAEKVKDLLGEKDIYVRFDKDKETKIMIMKFINKETKDVLKQFPAEVSIKIAKMIAQLTNAGAVTDAKV